MLAVIHVYGPIRPSKVNCTLKSTLDLRIPAYCFLTICNLLTAGQEYREL